MDRLVSLSHGLGNSLYDETRGTIESHGHTINDVLWVGAYDGTLSVNWDTFAEIARDVYYDSGFGGQEIASDLVVVGDNWWLSRGEYDGSEWWDYNTIPTLKDTRTSFTKVMRENYEYGLYEINFGRED